MPTFTAFPGRLWCRFESSQEMSRAAKHGQTQSQCEAGCGKPAPLPGSSNLFLNTSALSSGWTPRAEGEGFLAWTPTPYVCSKNFFSLNAGKTRGKHPSFHFLIFFFFKGRITILWNILTLMSYSNWLAFPVSLVGKYFLNGAGFWEACPRKCETRSSGLSLSQGHFYHFCCFTLQVWKGDRDPFSQFPAHQG